MKRISQRLGPAAAVIAIGVIIAAAARADDEKVNRYVVTNLVSNIPNTAPNTDPLLQNAWGVAFSPAGSPFWIADNATGCATLYDGTGVKQGLQVKIPVPGGGVANDCKPVDFNNPPKPTPAAPTGMIWNPGTNPMTAFLVPGTTIPAVFIFDTEDGTVSAWAGGLSPFDEAVIAATSSDGAVYKGLAFGVNEKGAFLFATDFHGGKIDVFAPNQDPMTHVGLAYTSATVDGGFADPNIPDGFAPFGIQNIDGNLFVTYAKQKLPDKHDDMAGPGNGFVDVFDTDGLLLRRLASRELLNSPWAVARASFAFGKFSDDILIGNFGDGKIHAVSDLSDREHSLKTLKDAKGKPIVIEGLWTLTLGGGAKSSPSTLYFTAGPNDETNGLFGTITPVSQ